MNKLNIHCIITFLLLCPFALRAEQDAALSKTNAPPIVVTNLATAVQAVDELRGFWPSQRREYVDSVNKILEVFSQHEENPDAQKAVRKMFDDVIALQTIYGDTIDNKYLGAKQAMLRAFMYNSKVINTDPEKWLTLAKFAGQMRGEIKPIDYNAHRRVTENGKTYIRRRSTPNLEPEDFLPIYLGEYQGSLKYGINDLMFLMRHGTHKAKFDDDSEREKFNDNLVKFAYFSEEDSALSKTNAFPIVVTDLVTAVRAVDELPDFWQTHWREYVGSVEQILDVLSQHEENSDVQDAVRKLFDDVIALQTVYGGAKDAEYLWHKRTMLKSLTSKSRIINTDPEKWLAIATFIGQMKDEIKPADYWHKMDLENQHDAMDTTHDVIVKGYKKIHLQNYDAILRRSINDLIVILVNNAHQAKFDEDSKRKEYNENLMKFSRFSDNDANEMRISTRGYIKVQSVTPPARATEPEK